MRILSLCLLMLFLFCTPCLAEWNYADTGLLVLRIVDWGQTRTVALNPDNYRELNPILGQHPDLGEVNAYFSVLILTDILIAEYANPKVHKFWQIIQITPELWCVGNNINLKLRCTF
ncbi:MAG TPA: hypothetical protein DDW65_25320 [Firmicutes bacterium]|jgi:hypothetical protein|nr:hypothetical protein [Bacillota bacterium]